MLLVIPFTWHAIFLTGSRGGLLGLIAVCGYVILKAKRVLLTAVLVPAFTIALVWQGGPMRQRGASIAEFEEDTSALGRLNAWQTGYEMMKDHPVTGVGIGNFMVAYRSYSQTRVRVAHSSVIQLGAETGVVAAVAYLLVFWNIYSQRRKVRKGRWGTASPLMETLGNATECSLLGFFVCSLFLNLATFEALYYLLVVRACWYHLRARAGAAQGSTAARPQVVEGSEVGAVLGV